MFNLHDFVMRTLRAMKDNDNEAHVREYALKWYLKGTLTDEDMTEIEGWYAEEEPTEEDIPEEDIPEEIEGTK